MKLRSQYYLLKPFIPWRVRMAVRRWFARRELARCQGVWPIKPGTERPPKDWSAWPKGNKFAVVLTHDVEGPKGLARVKQLAEIEMKLGFRSSFNFIPEGGYSVTKELRDWLTTNGFEVGVHDHRHDGKLYASRKAFADSAQRINHYLKEWNAAGFRSGFMHHNLDWIHDLNIEYDASTFDTDPFEPQPDGADTIFPFWVPAVQSSTLDVQGSKFDSPSPHSGSPPPSEALLRTRWGEGGRRPDEVLGEEGWRGIEGEGATQSSVQPSTNTAPPSPTENLAPNPQSAIRNPQSKGGYVELPYTLPQDSTLFLVFREKTIALWKAKLDWLAQNGAMALVNTHPDYFCFDGEKAGPREVTVDHYRVFLQYIKERYVGSYWHALPFELARWFRAQQVRPGREDGPTVAANRRGACPANGRGAKIWIDLDNTPHVPFFEPIIEELRASGYPVVVTARDAFQVCDLADKKGLHYVKVGRHNGKNPLLKGTGLLYRALQLAPFALREKPALAVSHGARSQILLSNFLRIPTIHIEDYEHSACPPMMRPTWIMAPSVIPDETLPGKNGRIRKYPGIKEDVYAWKLNPDPAILKKLGLLGSDLIVTVRPPATEAHYHNSESDKLFEAFMERACRTPQLKVVLLPRNKRQGDMIRQQVPKWFENGKTIIPNGAVDGMNLIWHSDLVVSGGGTMNREAAALGVPVYSIFRGTIGAVDQSLNQQGRLILIETVQDVETRIKLVKRPRKNVSDVTSKETLQAIVDAIKQTAETLTRH